MILIRLLRGALRRRARMGLKLVEHATVPKRALRRGRVTRETRREAQTTWWGKQPRWYPGSMPPRRHNEVRPLVDGDAYFDAFCRALDGAQHYVLIIGWCLTPRIPLRRSSTEDWIDTQLLAKLHMAAERVPVRLLLWSGAPALIEPTWKTVEGVQAEIEQHTEGADLLTRLDRTAGFSHTHHQKAVVVDGRVAFVGGIDLTTYTGDRWDTNAHVLRAGPNWHDIMMQIEGEAVGDVEHNFRQRWQEIAPDDPLPPAQPAQPVGTTPVQIVRTVPAGFYSFAPHGEFGIHHIYVQMLRRARRFVYIENQYLWSYEVVKALKAALADGDDRFRITIVLPAQANDGKWDNDRHVDELRDADEGRGRVGVYSLYTAGPSSGAGPFRYRPIYVHAKTAIVDDDWFTIGSANLNTRGLVTDGEMNALVHDPVQARALRVALWAEHLGLSRDDVAATTPDALADGPWRERATENAAIIRDCSGPLHGMVHHYQTGQMPGTGLLGELQDLAVEW